MLITRRSCLKGIATGLAAGLGPAPRAHAADDPARLPLGFSLYGMKELKVADALTACRGIGYDGVELALLPDWPTDPKRLAAADRGELRQRLADSNLALLGLMENLVEPVDEAAHRANLDRLKAAAELGHAVSPQAPPVVETVLGNKPAQWDEVKDRLAERMRSWAEAALAAKTVVCVKPHVAHALQRPEQALWLMKQVESPWLRLAYDFSHYELQGLPLKGTLADLVPHTAFVHVKDARGTPEKFEFLLPGEGTVDYAGYFRQLVAAGYRGPVVVEVSAQISNRPGYDPLTAARRSFEALATKMREAGIRK